MRQKLFLSAALIGLAIGPALAQTSGSGTTGSGQPPATSSPSSPSMSQSSPTTGATGSTSSTQMAAVPSGAIMGSRLTDMKVKGQGSDENIGEIDDVVVSQDGKIHQVIVQTGGVLGMGGKKVAIPWDQVKLNTTERVATISMSQDQLKNMPEFEEPDRQRSNRDRATPPARSGGGGTMGTGGAGGTTGTNR